MSVLNSGQRESVPLPALQILTVVASASGSGKIYRMGDKDGEASQGVTAIVASETKLIGPYSTPTRHLVVAAESTLTVSAAQVDFPTLVEVLAATVPSSGTVGDVKDYIGAGAPVDYTDGTPPATGEAEAGIGSRYTDTTGGNLYINGGTKAQPLWKLVTRAA